MNKPPLDLIKLAKDIYQTEYPPPEFLVPGMIPLTGLTILAGPVKGGKSWFVLHLHLLLSKSGIFLGRITVNVHKGMLLALEDSDGRLHYRMHCLGIEPGDQCLIMTSFHAGNESLSQLRKILSDDRTIEYMIIDTLGKISVGRGKKNGFQEDYDWVGGIKNLAAEFHVSIILVHHLRKMGDDYDVINEISGTCGSVAAADSLLVLKKNRITDKGTLTCTGRDFPDKKFDVIFSKETFQWSIIGESGETASTPERQTILDVLKAHGEMTPKEISSHVSLTAKAISNTLGKLETEGLVAKGSRFGSWVSNASSISSTSSASRETIEMPEAMPCLVENERE